MTEPLQIYRPIDEHATRIPMESGLLRCLYIPIAARSENAIETYVGRVVQQLSPGSLGKAFLVEAHTPVEPDRRLSIWNEPSASILHYPKQVWVDVDFRAYRRAYLQAFPEFDAKCFVLDHVLNRRVARLKGFQYIRIVPIARGTNSSHGALNEDWSVKYHSSPAMREKNRVSKASVQYADICDITKMLDIQGGGSNMDNVNDAQRLVDLPDKNGVRRISATGSSTGQK